MHYFNTHLGVVAARVLIIATSISTLAWGQTPNTIEFSQDRRKLTWTELPPIPDELGLAGPVVGVHRDVLIVGGGANFPRPVWETSKQWLSSLYGLRKVNSSYEWTTIGQLPAEFAYAACASTSRGIVIAGGNDSLQVFDRCWLAQVDPQKQQVDFRELPKLPRPCVYGQASAIGDVVYLAGGQSESNLASAMSNFWKLDLSKLSTEPSSLEWTELPACPGPNRAFNITVALGSSEEAKIVVLGGRRMMGDKVEFLSDCWEFNPRANRWKRLADLPRANTAGTAIGLDQSNLMVISGDDGALFTRTDELKDDHPGFPRKFYLYNSKSNTWSEADSPANQVTTLATWFDNRVVVPTGEIRPRVRTPKVWSVHH